jgi:hypothetical protein
MRYFFFSLLLTFSLSVIAQRHTFSNEVVNDAYGNKTMPYARGEVLKPEAVSDSRFPAGFRNRNVSTLDKITDIVTGWDELSPPQGFRASFRKIMNVAYNSDIYENLSSDPAPYFTSMLEIIFEPYYKGETGQPEVSANGVSAYVMLFINNPYEIVGSPLIDDIYVCPRQTADFYGYPVYQTNLDEITVVSKKQMPLFIPVSQEEYLRACIAYWEKELASDRAEQQKPENKLSAKEIFDSEKAERLKTMEEAYLELLKYDKEAAEELRKSSIDLENDLAVSLSGDPEADQSLSRILEDASSINRQIIDELKAELAALSPEQRGKQAHYEINAMEIYHNRSGLVPYDRAKPRENCEPLVRVNRKIVDTRSPEPQLLVIKWNILFTGTESHQRPRFFDNDKENYSAHTGDKNIAGLYKQRAIWQNIFGLVVK